MGTVAILTEAAVRARLDPPESRIPTTLYARPVAWGDRGGRAERVPIGTLAEGTAEWRVPVRLDEVPDRLIQAVLAVEDQRFYAHRGLDLRRIAGAAVANLRAGEVAQGGSTITQQLAKNLFLSARRTPLRKLREAAMAVMLEDRYDKERILEAYLNEIYLGQDGARALHGVGAAARYYFGKDVDDVTLAEAALLAGMIRAPNYYTPVRHAERARDRRALVLRLMVEQGRVSESGARRAARDRINTTPVGQPTIDARYFRDMVAERIRHEGGGKLPERGAAVYTTLDAAVQRAAMQAVHEGLAGVAARGAQAALVALDPRTGEILALVGGRDYAGSQFNRVTDARRQPGSAFKPIVALAALGREGRERPAFTLASEVEDEPLSVVTPAGLWEPENYDRGYRGTVTFREALEQSLNAPAIGGLRLVRGYHQRCLLGHSWYRQDLGPGLKGEEMKGSSRLHSPLEFSEILYEKMLPINPAIGKMALYEFRYAVENLYPLEGWDSIALESQEAIDKMIGQRAFYESIQLKPREKDRIVLDARIAQLVRMLFVGIVSGVYSMEWVNRFFYFDIRAFLFLPRTVYFTAAGIAHLGGKPCFRLEQCQKNFAQVQDIGYLDFMQANAMIDRAFIQLIKDLIRIKGLPLLMTLAGPTAAGKTEITEQMIATFEQMGYSATTIEMDNFLHDRDARDGKPMGKTTIHYKIFKDSLEAILRGETIQIPFYDSNHSISSHDMEGNLRPGFTCLQPGPWRLEEDQLDSSLLVLDATGDMLARAVAPLTGSMEANARLIAAAPELGEALASCVDYLIGPGNSPADGWGCLDRGADADRREAVAGARAALKKAGMW